MSNFATLIVMLVGVALAIFIVEYKTAQLEQQQNMPSGSVSFGAYPSQSR